MEQQRAIAIQLTEGGGFRIDGPKGVFAELGFDPECGEEPWSVSVMDGDGRCRHSESVSTLDIGLDRLAILGSATQKGLRGLYRVELPDGVSFQRPGTVPAEEILRKFDFSLVGSVRAFLVAQIDTAFTVSEAHHWFREKLGALAPLQGSTDLVESDSNEGCWCTDVLLPANGFYRAEGLLEFARSAVGACGVEMFSEISVRDDGLPAQGSGQVVQFAARAG
jgi:hypothetical protein